MTEGEGPDLARTVCSGQKSAETGNTWRSAFQLSSRNSGDNQNKW